MTRTPELIIEEVDIEGEYKSEITSLQSVLDFERRTNARLLQRVAELENEVLMLRLPKACEQCKIYCQLLDEIQKKSERREQELAAEAAPHGTASTPHRAVYGAIQPLPAHAITSEEIEPFLQSLSRQSPRGLGGSNGPEIRSPNRNGASKRSPRSSAGSAVRAKTPKSRSGSAKAGGRSGSARADQDSGRGKKSPGSKRSAQGLRSAKIGAQVQDYPSGKKRPTSKPSNPRNSQASVKPIKFGF